MIPLSSSKSAGFLVSPSTSQQNIDATFDRLGYDRDSRRYTVGDCELHCGDVIELLNGQAWIETRIEHNGDWVFVHAKPSDPHAWLHCAARRAR